MKADHASDRWRELREAEGFEVLGRRDDARRQIVERLVGREAQVMERGRNCDGRIIRIRVAAVFHDEVPSVVIHAMHVPAIPRVVRTQWVPVAIEHFVDERGVFHGLRSGRNDTMLNHCHV
ncbi:MAG: hypothetical protein JRF54_07565 [Deltaproteobacteria bacterium]|nr:hypothetical protein [Deltaproteobacteria bacterium]